MANMTFTKKGRYYVSSDFQGGDTGCVTIHLNFESVGKRLVLVQATSDASKGWSNQGSISCSDDVVEKNIRGIAPHQYIRLVVDAQPKSNLVIPF